ncbi:MAG: hypothetical protein RLZZ453_879 [Chlamydiota bacterium]|jgi:chaperonin cofactor prefoldin
MLPVKISGSRAVVQVQDDLSSALSELIAQVQEITSNVGLYDAQAALVQGLTDRVSLLEKSNSDLQRQVSELQKRLQEVEGAFKSNDCRRIQQERSDFSKHIAEAAARQRGSPSA